MKKIISYGLPLGALLAFVLLWMATGEAVGALLSLFVLALALALLLAVGGFLVSNAPSWWRSARGVSPEDHLLQLETSGKAVREHYQAVRALTFEDHSCGSLMHLVDIGENRILCLHGQYYFEFEPHDDDPEINQPRRFPTTTFSLLRDKERGDVLAISPGSKVLEPQVFEPIVERLGLTNLGVKFVDGAIVAGVTLDAAERALQPRRHLPARGVLP